MRIEEKTLVLPALYIIGRDGATSTSNLIVELTAAFHPTGEDAEILAGRRDTKFSQKVRNLKSHRDSNKMAEYTDINNRGQYTLTLAGKQFLDDNREQVEYLFQNQFPASEIADVIDAIEKTTDKKRKVYVYKEDEMVFEGEKTVSKSETRKRSRKLRDAAIAHYTQPDGKLYCAVCGFCFEDRYGEIGKGYAEIHHTNPVYQYSDDGFEAYISEAVDKVKPVCANCHRMIHRNAKRPLSIDELRTMLKQ